MNIAGIIVSSCLINFSNKLYLNFTIYVYYIVKTHINQFYYKVRIILNLRNEKQMMICQDEKKN